jgi:hypothetical protein
MDARLQGNENCAAARTGTQTMRGPKKSETLEIRLPHALKQAFMARCQGEGRSASEALRGLIEQTLVEPRRPPRRLRWAAVGLAAVSLGAVAAPSLARPSLPAQFARLDADHDGRLSLAEFERGASVQIALGSGAPAHDLASADREGLLRREFGRIDANRDGEIALDEFRRYYGR